MISKREILTHSREQGLLPNIIEKDYVIGWVLAGIHASQDYFKNWVFKGGTCIKKCYFMDYRFSEDLDYTITGIDHIDIEEINTNLLKATKWITDQTGIQINLNKTDFVRHTNKHGHNSVQGKIYYGGPIAEQSVRNWPRIKLDLTCNEKLVHSPVFRPILHGYSDINHLKESVQAYSYTEIFAEKIRALGERVRARDLFDVIELYNRKDKSCTPSIIRLTMQKKCDFKNLPSINMNQVSTMYENFKGGWGSQLKNQLPDPPDFYDYWKNLEEVFNWVES